MLCKVQYSDYFSILQLIGEEPQDGQFETIAVYYDNGQSAVSITIHDALIYQTRRMAGSARGVQNLHVFSFSN